MRYKILLGVSALIFAWPNNAKADALMTDVVGTVCKVLSRQNLATECHSDINLLEENWMVVHGRFSSLEADAACRTIAGHAARIAKSSKVKRHRAWQVRLHTPFTGDRPLAVCRVP